MTVIVQKRFSRPFKYALFRVISLFIPDLLHLCKVITKIIQICFGVAYLCFMISLNQSESKEIAVVYS